MSEGEFESWNEEVAYRAIARGEHNPDPAEYQAGWEAHACGLSLFHGPRPTTTVRSLSWRIGWNDRERRFLQQRR